MSAGFPPVLLWLDRVFVLTSMLGCAAWIVEYSVNRGWRNSMGRTLLTKTSLLTALLALSALSSWFGLNRNTSLAIAWIGMALLGAIGPVMVWRIVVFHRIGQASRHCPAGHRVSFTALFCPECGTRLPPPAPPAD